RVRELVVRAVDLEEAVAGQDPGRPSRRVLERRDHDDLAGRLLDVDEDADPAELALSVDLELLLLLGRDELAVGVEALLDHALDGAVAELVAVGLLDPAVEDQVAHLRDRPELLILHPARVDERRLVDEEGENERERARDRPATRK